MEPLRCHLILTPTTTTTTCNKNNNTDMDIDMDMNIAITCDDKGSVSTTTSRKQSEEWFIILHDGAGGEQAGGEQFEEQGQGKGQDPRGQEYHDQQNSSMITLVNCANGQYLISDRQGVVSTSSNPSERQELWKMMMRNSPSTNRMQQPSPSSSSTTTSSISVHERYSISSAESGRYLSKSISQSYINDKGKKSTVGGEICTILNHVSPITWCFNIEILSGELCFISSPWSQKQLSCSSWWKPGMVSTWLGNEVWRFIEVGDGNGTVRIMRWKDKSILTSDASGKVYTIALSSLAQTQAKIRDGSKWMVDLAPDVLGRNEDSPSGVTFKSVVHNRYLQVGPKETIGTSKYLAGSPSVWQVEAGHRQQCFISCTAHDKRISRDMDTAPNQAEGRNGQVSHSGTSNWGASEVWEIEHHHHRGGCFICLKSPLRHSKHHNEDACKFLNSDQGGNIYETDTLGENALWKLESIPNDLENIAIVSEASGGYLSCRNGDFYLWTRNVDDIGKDEVWCLQPVLPGMIVNQNTHSNALSFLGGSALGMALGPLALMGTVGAIGFGVGGIGAGSCAAWMMSLEGGATAAGGLVAAMQSVGAAGLGATGVAASMTAGAVIGGSASTVAVEAVSGLKQKQLDGNSGGEKSIIDDPTNSTHSNRPFCDWKSW